MEDAQRAMLQTAHAMHGDWHGVRTISGAKGAYVRGDIEIEEFERRVELFLSGRPLTVLQPGEQILMLNLPT